LALVSSPSRAITEAMDGRDCRGYRLPSSVQHIKHTNKATAMRVLHHEQTLHAKKLATMKPSIDMAAPKAYPHVSFNAKRMQMEAERNSAIERENKILLGKMYTIMNSESEMLKDNGAQRGSVTSLNMTVRKQEYDRIARENQAIMQRILHRAPHFDRVTIDEDWKKTQGYLKNISEYPFILGHPTPKPRRLKPLGGYGDDAGAYADVAPEVSVKLVTSVAEDGDLTTRCMVNTPP